jgi:hypothetical protein
MSNNLVSEQAGEFIEHETVQTDSENEIVRSDIKIRVKLDNLFAPVTPIRNPIIHSKYIGKLNY